MNSQSITLHPISRIFGKPVIPPDKSISHRALLFGGLANGRTRIQNLLVSGDVQSTWRCLEQLGVKIHEEKGDVFVDGKGLKNFHRTSVVLDCGNSGTTLRLLLGILAGFPSEVQLTGDASLSRRPMARIADPLRKMGARVRLTEENYAPLWIEGSTNLRPLEYSLPVASAQLKSALLLAGLSAHGLTTLTGKLQSRDHTERLLPSFGVQIERDLGAEASLQIRGGQKLYASDVIVPGDASSAAFWVALALLVPGSDLILEGVSINPFRIGFMKIAQRMGAQIETEIQVDAPEPIGTMRVKAGPLVATHIAANEVPSLIDELPLIALLAVFAEGETRVEGAAELRVKESDRIETLARNLRAMGVVIDTFSDGFSIRGPQKLRGAVLDSDHDHRIAMTFSIAALVAEGSSTLLNTHCVEISYPSFYKTLKEVTR